MKKYFYYLFALTAMVMFSSCINGDEPNTKQSFTSTINCRAIDGDDVIFSQGSAKVEVDYSELFIKFTADYKDAEGMAHSLTTPDMKLYAVSSSVYTFNNMASSTYTGIDMLQGSIDFATGMMWYSFNVDGSTKVVCTTHLLYAYTNTTITDPESGNHGTHQQSAYLFALDAKGQTCTMKISNFMCNLNSAVDVIEIQYDDLTVTPTTTGYIISAEMVESSNRGSYTLTNVNFNLNDQCQVINGSFKCNDLQFNVDGNLFSFAQ